MSSPALHSITETLYREHQPWLKDWLRRRLGCNQRAADLAQDTFVRVISSRNLVISEPRGYLATVARGLMVDMFRRQRIETAYLEALTLQPQLETIELEAQAIIIETLVELDQLLDQLGARTRAVFLLAQLEGLTQAEIGQRLNISLPTVRKHLVRAFTECLLLVAEQ